MEDGRRRTRSDRGHDPRFLPAAAGSGLHGPTRAGDAAAAAAASSPANTVAIVGAGKGIEVLKRVTAAGLGGCLLRRSNALWAQPRRSSGLVSRRREGPLPPWPPGAKATSFSWSAFPLLPPGGRRRHAHSHTHHGEPRPRRLQSCRRAYGPRLRGSLRAKCGRRPPGWQFWAVRGGARLAGGDKAPAGALLRPRPCSY